MVSVNGNQIMIGARQFCDSLEGITLECRLVTVVSEDIIGVIVRESWFVVVENARGKRIRIGALGI